MQLKQIAKVGYVLPSEENKETEKALRRIATKGGWSREMNALFNAVSRSKRLNPIIDKKNEKRKSGDGRAR